MDRMRESVFAILGDLGGATFLDLFAGSGIIGIEAASRGASRIVMVERDRKKREVLRSNVLIAEMPIELVLAPVESYLRSESDGFDYIFLDPPFAYKGKERLLRQLPVNSGATIMLHHPGDSLPAAIPGLIRIDQRTYGGSHVDFYRSTIDDFGPIGPAID